MFLYYGHAYTNGTLTLNGKKSGSFGYDQLYEVWRRRKMAGRGKLESVGLYGCYTLSLGYAWLAISGIVDGFWGATTSLWSWESLESPTLRLPVHFPGRGPSSGQDKKGFKDSNEAT
jgi:hypothetical protein